MKVNGIHYRSIWFDHAAGEVNIIDQRRLPHEFRIAVLDTLEEFATAIRDMWVRGAPLIGATAAYGVAREIARDPTDAALTRIHETLHATRPTAINLRWALTRCADALRPLRPCERPAAALATAHEIAEEDVETNRMIGVHGLELIRAAAAKKPAGAPVNILTHCNAGWPATVDWGTATSPMYHAHDAGIPIHIWVDETRPRNQGAMTAWELGSHGIPHTYITDNAGGHLMQHGEVDMVITGTDRTTARGDVCNKIGTYLKALAAHDNGVPFYVGLPSPTIDWTVADGIADIPIEERPQREVTHIWGREDSAGDAAGRRGKPVDAPERNGSDQKGDAPFGTAARSGSDKKGGWAGKNMGGVGGIPPHADGSPGRGNDVEIGEVQVAPEGSPGGNPAFDVTPARLVTGLITERGISPASAEGLASLFPEHAA